MQGPTKQDRMDELNDTIMEAVSVSLDNDRLTYYEVIQVLALIIQYLADVTNHRANH